MDRATPSHKHGLYCRFGTGRGGGGEGGEHTPGPGSLRPRDGEVRVGRWSANLIEHVESFKQFGFRDPSAPGRSAQQHAGKNEQPPSVCFAYEIPASTPCQNLFKGRPGEPVRPCKESGEAHHHTGHVPGTLPPDSLLG